MLENIYRNEDFARRQAAFMDCLRAAVPRRDAPGPCSPSQSRKRDSSPQGASHPESCKSISLPSGGEVACEARRRGLPSHSAVPRWDAPGPCSPSQSCKRDSSPQGASQSDPCKSISLPFQGEVACEARRRGLPSHSAGTAAAIYVRLSQEDRDKSDPSAESRSIQNQKQLLLQYAEEQGWQVMDIYCDEDYSGSDRLRPAFQKLLHDAEAGRFHIILCKSQSRFTRELELVEKYINGLFLDWGIRFVSVTDHVDTGQQGGRKLRQLGGLINQWYLEDLSDSIRAVLRDHQRQGLHIGSFAPYGYQKDPAVPGKLFPDEEAAAVVRRIFRDFDEGKGKTAIASALNREGIPNPSRYKELAGYRYRSKYGSSNSGLWQYSTVAAVLRNPVYSGVIAQHRSEKISYKSKRLRSLPRDQWLVVEGCHEPLIAPDLWQRVQEKLSSASRPSYGGRVGIFAGKLRCLYCGRTLRRCKSSKGRCYYRCSGAQVHSGCAGGFIPHGELEQLLYAQFLEQWQQLFSPQLLKRQESARPLQENLAAQKQLYEDYLRGKVRADWYEELSQRLQAEAAALEAAAHFSAVTSPPEKLDRQLIDCFIEKIDAGKREKATGQVPVHIHWRF